MTNKSSVKMHRITSKSVRFIMSRVEKARMTDHQFPNSHKIMNDNEKCGMSKTTGLSNLSKFVRYNINIALTL